MKVLEILCIAVIIGLISTTNSCTDPCKEKICIKGYCIDGDCFCLEGYSGGYCEIAERDKFRGNYIGQQRCPEGVQNLKLKISDEGDDPRDIKLSIDNYSVEIILRARVKGDSLFIANQWVLINYPSGPITNLFGDSKGIIKGDSLLMFELSYYYEDGIFDKCTIEATRD